MTREAILAKDVIDAWRKEPEFVAAYDALASEFALAEALIDARAQADMKQEQVDAKMGTIP